MCQLVIYSSRRYLHPHFAPSYLIRDPFSYACVCSADSDAPRPCQGRASTARSYELIRRRWDEGGWERRQVLRRGGVDAALFGGRGWGKLVPSCTQSPWRRDRRRGWCRRGGRGPEGCEPATLGSTSHVLPLTVKERCIILFVVDVVPLELGVVRVYMLGQPVILRTHPVLL